MTDLVSVVEYFKLWAKRDDVIQDVSGMLWMELNAVNLNAGYFWSLPLVTWDSDTARCFYEHVNMVMIINGNTDKYLFYDRIYEIFMFCSIKLLCCCFQVIPVWWWKLLLSTNFAETSEVLKEGPIKLDKVARGRGWLSFSVSHRLMPSTSHVVYGNCQRRLTGWSYWRRESFSPLHLFAKEEETPNWGGGSVSFRLQENRRCIGCCH